MIPFDREVLRAYPSLSMSAPAAIPLGGLSQRHLTNSNNSLGGDQPAARESPLRARAMD
jgi:hypothetical protein